MARALAHSLHGTIAVYKERSFRFLSVVPSKSIIEALPDASFVIQQISYQQSHCTSLATRIPEFNDDFDRARTRGDAFGLLMVL